MESATEETGVPGVTKKHVLSSPTSTGWLPKHGRCETKTELFNHQGKHNMWQKHHPHSEAWRRQHHADTYCGAQFTYITQF